MKTIEYHPNCSVAKVLFHDDRKGTTLSSSRETINELLSVANIDDMPVIKGFEEHSFELGLRMLIQQ